MLPRISLYRPNFLAIRSTITFKPFSLSRSFSKRGKDDDSNDSKTPKNKDKKDDEDKMDGKKEHRDPEFEHHDMTNQDIYNMLIDPHHYSMSSRTNDSSELLNDIQSTKWAEESFVVNLFRGVVKTSQCFPFPQVLTNEQEHELLQVLGPIEEFLKNENNPRVTDENEAIPSKVIQRLADLGMLRLSIPKQYGGFGFNHTQVTHLTQCYGTYDLNIAGFMSGHQCLGYKAIRLYGSPNQQEKYLTMIAKEKKVAAFALSEPTAETDLAAIKSRAKLDDTRKYYILNGIKSNVINGEIADIFTVFALTESMEHDLQITCLIVEKSFGGIVSGKSLKRLGMCGVNQTNVEFKNVKVPVENVIGQLADGYLIAMRVLNHGRFGIAAALSGTMTSVMEKAIKFASERKQFGRSISSYGAIQGKLAAMAMNQYVNECLAYMIAGNMDNGFTDFYVEAAISKCFSSKVTFDGVDETIQIFGGKGYERRYGIERVLRDVRYYRLHSGTNDILRLFIALTGIQYASIDQPDVQEAYKNPTTHLGLIFGHPSRLSVDENFYGMTPSIAHLVHPKLLSAATWATESVTKFGNVVEMLLDVHGRQVVEKQYNLIQLANAAIYTYAMVVTLSRCNVSLYNELPTADFELSLSEAFVMDASTMVRGILDALESKSHQEIRSKLEVVTHHIIKKGGIVQSSM